VWDGIPDWRNIPITLIDPWLRGVECNRLLTTVNFRFARDTPTIQKCGFPEEDFWPGIISG